VRALVGLYACAACGGDPPVDTVPACLGVAPDVACTTALYGDHDGKLAPTYADVFTNTLKPECATMGCHTAPDPPNGLAFDDEATSYAALLSMNAAGTGPRLVPGDAKCGELVVRLETAGKSWSMPQGGHLDDATLCAIRRFIADGAPQK
jgi:hypothetical protein